MEESPIILSQEERAEVSLTIGETTQPEIGEEEEGDFLMEDVDDVEEERELLKNELKRLQKVDSVATISSLKMKLDTYSRMRILPLVENKLSMTAVYNCVTSHLRHYCQ